MRSALRILEEEMRRLKAAGVASVPVSDQSLEALRKAVRRQRGQVSTLNTSVESRDLTPSKQTLSALPPPPAVSLPAGSKQDRWNALREMVLNDPTCRAHVRPGKKVVLGVGSLDAKIMFVGEAPGADEEVRGEPFVGPAGQLLDRMIAATGLTRAEVYIGNIMNWRPEISSEGGVQSGNRPPTAGEMAYCLPYLLSQISIVDPQILVALGATAAHGLIGPGTFTALGEVRGRWREWQGKPLIITYHPSYILRNPTNKSKRMIWEDFLKIMERAGLPVSDRQRGYFAGR